MLAVPEIISATNAGSSPKANIVLNAPVVNGCAYCASSAGAVFAGDAGRAGNNQRDKRRLFPESEHRPQRPGRERLRILSELGLDIGIQAAQQRYATDEHLRVAAFGHQALRGAPAAAAEPRVLPG